MSRLHHTRRRTHRLGKFLARPVIKETPVIVENPTVRPILEEEPDEPEERPVFDAEGIPLNEDDAPVMDSTLTSGWRLA